MKKSKSAVKEINKIISSDNLPTLLKTQLLDIKKYIEFGELNFTEGLNNSMLMSFYIDYVEDISKWLNVPQSVIRLRILNNKLTEVENKLIITNILLLNKQKMEEDYENLY